MDVCNKAIVKRKLVSAVTLKKSICLFDCLFNHLFVHSFIFGEFVFPYPKAENSSKHMLNTHYAKTFTLLSVWRLVSTDSGHTVYLFHFLKGVWCKSYRQSPCTHTHIRLVNDSALFFHHMFFVVFLRPQQNNIALWSKYAQKQSKRRS